MLSLPVPREPRLLVALLLASVIGLSGLRAQDVTVGDPVVVAPVPLPDELPKVRGRLRPDYPDEMRKADETGYVIIARYIDASGTSRLLQAYGTHLPFQRAVEEQLSAWKMSAGRHQGVAVDVFMWIPVIFNPKSSDPKLAEAKPRLLAVAPVITRERPASTNQPPVVRMRLSLDATGTLIRAEPAETEIGAKVLAAIRESLQAWRFAPARKAGQPVAAEMEVAVICQPPPPKPDTVKQVPPKPLKQTPPHYPEAMRRYGLRGTVVISFVIDTDGSVRNPTILRSDNPAFDEPAIEAILQWKYVPATGDGKPLKTRAQQELRFDLPGIMARDAFTITAPSDQTKLPPEFRYDTGPKIRGVQVPVYPTELRRAGIRGHARVSILIDTQGRVARAKVIEADRPEFGLALVAATEGFRFDPALNNGRPVPSLLGLEQDFNNRELPDLKAERLLSLEKEHPERILTGAALGTALKPVSRPSPVFPVTAPLEADHGSATVEFLVDEDGRARLPRIVDASDPAFGYAAVQAVSAWWFEPPRKAGKAVVTRVQAPFNFGLNTPTEPAAPPVPGAPVESATGK